MKRTFFLCLVLFSFLGKFSHAGQRSYSSVHEIKKLLQLHPRLREEYLYFVAENPGVRMAEAHVHYFIIVDESFGEREYRCELNTRLILTSKHELSDKVEVDRKCEDLFK